MKKKKKVFAGFVIKAGKTIEVYTHVSTKNLCYIVTPGDGLSPDTGKITEQKVRDMYQFGGIYDICLLSSCCVACRGEERR